MSERDNEDSVAIPVDIDGMRMTIIKGKGRDRMLLGWPGDEACTSMPRLGLFTSMVRAAAAQSEKKPGDDR